MNFKEKYPDFAAVERHIHAARVERAVYLANAIVHGIEITIHGLKRFGAALSRGLRATADRRAVESDTFLERSVPKY